MNTLEIAAIVLVILSVVLVLMLLYASAGHRYEPSQEIRRILDRQQEGFSYRETTDTIEYTLPTTSRNMTKVNITMSKDGIKLEEK